MSKPTNTFKLINSTTIKLNNQIYTLITNTDNYKSFIKYNDRQDQFRHVPHTWRRLLPALDQSLTKSLG